MVARRIRTIGAMLALAAALTPFGGTPAAAAPAAPVGVATVGLQGWRVQSSASVPQLGDQVSQPGFSTDGWLAVEPDDAGAPGTEIEALLQNGVCPHDPSFPVHQGGRLDTTNVFFSNNLQRCFGMEPGVGPDTIPEFMVPWWYRTDFRAGAPPGTAVSLVVNGVVGQADVWVNGVEVGTQATVRGAFTNDAIDVTDLLRPGVNSLALELFPNDPNSMLTLDNVDWTQVPPDNSTGIQFPVQLHVSRALAIGNAHVVQDDAPDLSSASLTARADVTNTTASAQTGTVSATITPPDGGAPIRLTQDVTVPAGATRTVTFAPATVQHPAVWWPYQMGGQPLYRLTTDVSQHGTVSDVAPASTFGIRTVSTYLTPPSDMARDGVRVFAINGRPMVVRGGGFTEDLFLHYSAADLGSQVALIRSMGLNAIRTEGKEMPADFYAQMDRAGILIDAGFQCCDSWQPDGRGQGVTAQDYRTMYESSLAIGQRLRGHPSVINFSWSDNNPIPEQEAVSLAGFAQADFREPVISSAENNRSAIAGPAGEKEGPYDWVPPGYWYDTTHASNNAADNDSTLTNVGGSWGFDSEQSAGDTVPTLDSARRFLSPAELSALWRQPDAHQYHTNYESLDGEHVGYAFGTLFNLDQAITNRYGSWSSLPQYVQEAQVQNYEDTRAQFEAFIDHWNNSPTPSTGTIYWQLNKGWPTLLWDLYDNDYDLAGSHFGAKKANERLHALYTYDDGTVTVDNLTGAARSDVSVEARVHDLAGSVIDDQVARGLSVPSQGVRNRVLTPRVPAPTVPPAPAQTFWVELLLRQGGGVVSRNVYWLSTRRDVVDWTDSQGNPQALTSATTSGLPQYADLRALQGLPASAVTAVASSRPRGSDTVTAVTITNRSPAVAFFLRADVRRGGAGGDDQVLPITWSDDDVTLWPGQSQTLTATYASSALGGAAPVVSVAGWNQAGLVVPAPFGTASAAAERTAESAAGVEHVGAADGTPLNAGAASPAASTPARPAPAAAAGVAWRIASAASPSTFTQGEGASYTLTVSNAGGAATDGSTPVTVTDVVDPDLSLASLSGPGWSCDTSNDPTEVCTRGDALAPGQSYPPLTLKVDVSALAGSGSQDSTAGLHVTNAVSVAGGAPARPSAFRAFETPVTGPPDLTADDAIDGPFRQGDAGARYQVTVINQGAGPTTGAPIVATMSVPAGETPVALYGSGWACSLSTTSCSRTDVLRGENGEAPPIALVVRLAPDAPAHVTQKVTVSGGGERLSRRTVSAPTEILPFSPAPAARPGPLAVTSAHAGAFAQGGAGRYTLSVRNASDRPSSGRVTVTDVLPAGLAATRMTGAGWACSLQPAAPAGPLDTFEPLATCSRSDALAPGAAYPPITLAVAVRDDALPSVTSTVTVAGGGGSMTATDGTAIDQRADLSVTAFPTSRGVPFAPFARGDGAGQGDRYTITVANAGFAPTDGAATLTVALPAGLRPLSMSGAGWSCSAATTTCTTRAGVRLAPGARSVITLGLAVAGDAPRGAQTWMQVSGGGEIEPAGDAYLVPAAIGEG